MSMNKVMSLRRDEFGVNMSSTPSSILYNNIIIMFVIETLIKTCSITFELVI